MSLSLRHKSLRCFFQHFLEYLQEVKTFRSAKTISACEQMLNGFATNYGGRSIADINRADLLAHMVRLRSKGLGPRTIFNHTEKVVSAYHSEQLTALFTAASADERMLFQFFLATGFREQEVMHCTWSNVDFRD